MMPCIYCNSTKSPNPDGSCPDCGNIAPKANSTQQPTASSSEIEAKKYPIQHWRCTWMIVLFKLVNAILMAAVFAAGVWALYHFVDNAELDKWEKVVWIVAMAIPAVYFLFGFIGFVFNWFIKRYELRAKDIRLIKGFFNMSTNSTLLEALWGMKLRQDLFQRYFFGTGRITLFSDDATSPILHINDIGNVRQRFKDLARYQEYALDCSNVKVEKDNNIDTSTQEWKYSKRDLIDEVIWGVVITVILVVAGLYIPWGNAYLRFSFVLIIPVLYWCWLLWTFIDKICCTKYILNNATLIKESGILYKKIDVYVLCHIKDCEMSQNLWQRIVGDVGNITLYLKWENKDKRDGDGGSLSTTKKDVLHGLADHAKKFELFKERWLRERHRRQA